MTGKDSFWDQLGCAAMILAGGLAVALVVLAFAVA